MAGKKPIEVVGRFGLGSDGRLTGGGMKKMCRLIVAGGYTQIESTEEDRKKAGPGEVVYRFSQYPLCGSKSTLG